MIYICGNKANVIGQCAGKKQRVAMCELHAQRAKQIGALLGWEIVFEPCMNGERCIMPSEVRAEVFSGGAGDGKAKDKVKELS